MQIIRPSDFHVHLRQDCILSKVLPYTSTIFANALIMPNVSPPLSNIINTIQYRKQILTYNTSSTFMPHFAYYLTDNSNIEELEIGPLTVNK